MDTVLGGCRGPLPRETVDETSVPTPLESQVWSGQHPLQPPSQTLPVHGNLGGCRYRQDWSRVLEMPLVLGGETAPDIAGKSLTLSGVTINTDQNGHEVPGATSFSKSRLPYSVGSPSGRPGAPRTRG